MIWLINSKYHISYLMDLKRVALVIAAQNKMVAVYVRI